MARGFGIEPILALLLAHGGHQVSDIYAQELKGLLGFILGQSVSATDRAAICKAYEHVISHYPPVSRLLEQGHAQPRLDDLTNSYRLKEWHIAPLPQALEKSPSISAMHIAALILACAHAQNSGITMPVLLKGANNKLLEYLFSDSSISRDEMDQATQSEVAHAYLKRKYSGLISAIELPEELLIGSAGNERTMEWARDVKNGMAIQASDIQPMTLKEYHRALKAVGDDILKRYEQCVPSGQEETYCCSELCRKFGVKERSGAGEALLLLFDIAKKQDDSVSIENFMRAHNEAQKSILVIELCDQSATRLLSLLRDAPSLRPYVREADDDALPGRIQIALDISGIAGDPRNRSVHAVHVGPMQALRDLAGVKAPARAAAR